MTSSSKALSNTYKYLLRMVFIMVILSVGLGVIRANAFGAINDTSYEIINYDFKAVVKKNHVYEVTKKLQSIFQIIYPSSSSIFLPETIWSARQMLRARILSCARMGINITSSSRIRLSSRRESTPTISPML